MEKPAPSDTPPNAKAPGEETEGLGEDSNIRRDREYSNEDAVTQYRKPNLATARRHIELLTGSPDTPVHLRLFHDGKEKHKKSSTDAPARKLPLGSVAKHWPDIEGLQAEGYGVFFVVNEGGNTDNEIKAIRALFVDFDAAAEPSSWHVEPDFIVRRDLDHLHAYWLIASGFPIDRFRSSQSRLAELYGSDPTVSNPSRVLRLAGTLHLKDPASARLITLEDRAERVTHGGIGHTFEELTADLPASNVVPLSASRKIKQAALIDTLDPDEARSRVKAFLTTAEPAVEGQKGDDQTFKVAAEALNLGVSEEVAFELMQPWNERCVPPWEDDELKEKIANARRYMQNEAGSKTAPPMAEQLRGPLARIISAQSDAPAITGTQAPGKFLTLADLLNRTPLPVEELIPGLVERHTATFLAGPGGSHKSRLAIQWGLCIATGTPVWGRPIEPATFVYLSYEDPVDEVTRRVHAIADRLKLPAEGALQYFDLAGRDAPLVTVKENGDVTETPHGAWFREHLKSLGGDKYVVLDGTYNAFRFVGKAKINEGAVMAAITWLHHLCAETESTIIPLWHPSQAGQERGDASGWSVAWHNAPRARLSLTPVRDTDGAFELKTEKRNHGPKGPSLTLHFDAGILSPWGGPTDEGEDVLKRAVARVAISAATHHAPINKREHLRGWQMGEIEKSIGRRPTQKQAKEALAACLPAGLLHYVNFSRHKAAGYYPPELETAHTLAIEAKKSADGKDAE